MDGVDAQPGFIATCRLLIALIALLLLATPWTEAYRLLDNFPRGQDSEVHLLALLAFLGLVLLLARASKRGMRIALMAAGWLRAAIADALRLLTAAARAMTRQVCHSPPLTMWPVDACRLPLRI